MNRFSALIILSALMIASGCASDHAHSRFLVFENHLSKEVARWSRTAKLYQQFDTVLIVDAVYNSAALREDWVKRTAEVKRLSDNDRESLLKTQRKENDAIAQFYVAFYTPFEKWDDLADSGTKWAVFLESDGGPVKAMSIDKVDIEALPWSTNLAFSSNFRSLYRINFPRAKVGFGAQTLVLSSLLGEVALKWEAD